MQLGVGSSGGRGHRGVTPSSPALLPPLLPHVGDDVVLHGGDVGAVVPAHDGHAVGAHQELLEVPLDVVVPQGLPEEVLGVPELLRHRWAGVLQGWGDRSVPCVSPSPKRKHAGCWPPLWHCTHLQEAVDLLLLGPVHIPFLEELEVGDEAASWPDVPAGGQQGVTHTSPTGGAPPNLISNPRGTHFSAGRISEFWPGSCFPNWLEGKPRTTSP